MTREKEIVERVKALAAKAAGDHGATLWDVELATEAGRRVLRVTIDRPEGVDLAACEAVSRDLSTYLDVEDAVPFRHSLEVSSPGLTRALKTADDFRRSIGYLAVLVLSEPAQGSSRWRGIIRGVEDSGPTVVLEAEGREVAVPLRLIRRAHRDIEF